MVPNSGFFVWRWRRHSATLLEFWGRPNKRCALWEKHRRKAIPGPADRLMRALYDECVGRDGSLRRMVERLARLDQVRGARGNFRAINHRWRPAAASA